MRATMEKTVKFSNVVEAISWPERVSSRTVMTEARDESLRRIMKDVPIGGRMILAACGRMTLDII